MASDEKALRSRVHFGNISKVKTCTKCLQSLPFSAFNKSSRGLNGLYSQCKECTAEAQRAWRAENVNHYRAYCKTVYAENHTVRAQKVLRGRERYQAAAQALRERMYANPNRKQNRENYRAKHPERERARQAVKRAVKAGRLTRKPCAVCDNPKTQGHHPDYAKPLEVIWLCNKHHGHAHRLTLN